MLHVHLAPGALSYREAAVLDERLVALVLLFLCLGAVGGTR